MRPISFLFLLFCIVGCSKDRPNFYGEFEKSSSVYFSSDRIAAKNAVIAFIDLTERNEAIARSEESFAYDRVLAISWLRLWSIYNIEDNKSKSEEAMDRSIVYFDRFPEVASSNPYKNNKKAALAKFLIETESYKTPEWKSRSERVMP